jgi:hypothetical protein
MRRLWRRIRAWWYRGECLIVVKKAGAQTRILEHTPGLVQEHTLLKGSGRGPVYLTIIPKYGAD